MHIGSTYSDRRNYYSKSTGKDYCPYKRRITTYDLDRYKNSKIRTSSTKKATLVRELKTQNVLGIDANSMSYNTF
uniref:Peptidase M12A domain-containing protein n=1 Tax=Romanomermis culicivorax TaxID=13658 RepID=A0A915K4D5_ROMCU